MTIANGYTTLAIVKARLGIATADTADDTKMETMVEGISRAIDGFCDRRFFVNGTDEVRYFTAPDRDELFAGDIVSLTSIATDEDGDRVYETAWGAGDWELQPYNAALDGQPYTMISTTPNGVYGFPSVAKGVKLTGKFGWSAVPAPVSEACLLMTEKLFRRKDAIFGVVASLEGGYLKQMIQDDPELKLLLGPYRWYNVLGT